MANVDGEVRIKTAIDNSDLDKGMKEADSKIKSATEKIKGNFTKAAGAAAGAAAAVALIKGAIDEVTKAYRTQATAEKQLESSAKNNPYLTSESVQRLKDYAGQLQAISTTGDEELLPFMGLLASMGRTEAQSMEIMAVALDVAASGAMSLESAVVNLSKTFGGYAGELGEINPQVAALTQEELKNGEAVKIMKAQYAGIAQEVARASGSAQQLQNTIGDLKEELGAPFEKALTPVRNFFNEIIGGWASALKARREYEEAAEKNAAGAGTAATVKTQLDVEREKLEKLTKAYEELEKKVSGKTGVKTNLPAYLTGESAGITSSRDTATIQAQAELKTAKEQLEAKRKLVENLEKEYELKKQIEKSDAEKKTALEEEARLLAEKNERDAKVLEYMQENEKALKKQLESLRIEAEQTGKNASEQDKFNAMLQSYISLITESNGLITENNQYAQKRLENLREQAELARIEAEREAESLETEEQKVEVNEKLKSLLDAMAEMSVGDNESIITQLENQLSQLDTLYKDVINTTELTEKQRLEIETEYGEKRKTLEKQIAEAKKQYAIQNVQEITNTVSNLAGQLESVISQATALSAQANEAETERQLSNIAAQYNEGIISYEEYIAKKEKIDKQAAQKQYKLDMFNWTASLLTATANIAQGVTKAIAENSILGIVTGSLVAAAGALQIATITANKPRPPSFAGGGIVPGTSYSGDRVQANVNSGEMILNAQQQRNLWDIANSRAGGSGVVNVPITIENTISDKARASAEITESGIRVIIDDMVNSSMKEGRYTDSMAIAQSRGDGVRYL